jgi:hypothetical protein
MSGKSGSSGGSGKSRSVHPNNVASKSGGSATFQKPITPAKLTKKPKKVSTQETRTKTPIEKKQDLIEKEAAQAKKKARISESHFSIPDVEENNNLKEQLYKVSHIKHAILINEIKTRSKVAAFASDFEHIQLN